MTTGPDWVAAVVHHVDDLIAEDYVGSVEAFALRTVVVLAVQIVATIWALERRWYGYALLSLTAAWWFLTSFVGHVAEVTRPVTEIADADPAGWAPVFVAAVLVGGAASAALMALCAGRLIDTFRR